ncbi:MAG: cysteine desulfurase [Acidobacteria bacterium]|nr:cysteine desulfurase [Acidobacteriota bacterium]
MKTVYDVQEIRADFPILHQTVRGKPLIYLDNAATSQKPKAVLEAVNHFYTHDNSNVHRGVHVLSERATRAFEQARLRARQFINAPEAREIIFVRGSTEGVNLVAQTYGRQNVGPGDEILISTLEHHSNIVPWQMLCEEKQARLRVIPINDEGEILLDEYEKLLSEKTKLVAMIHVSNSLGTINPVRRVVELAHLRGVPVLLDGAQAAPHLKIDVQELGCDFYTISGHKMFGPTGIGVLYGRTELLDAMPPYQGGGEMIRSVSFEKTTYNQLPHKFEAGTPNISGAVGLGAAMNYISSIGYEAIAAHEHDLLEYATAQLTSIPKVRLVGTARQKASVISFTIEGVHAHDVGTILDQDGIAVRAGHHCTQPLMERLGLDATARASFAFYNTREEVDALVEGVHRVIEVFD